MSGGEPSFGGKYSKEWEQGGPWVVGGGKLQVQVMIKAGLPARWHLSEAGRRKGREPRGYQSEGIKTEEPRSEV